MTIIGARALELDHITLLKGGHAENNDLSVCLLEAVAYVAGEPWSDHPQCVCPVLAAFGRAWNDALPDDARQRLKPYVVRLVGTRSTSEVEQRRSWMACDWLVRVFTPAWLRRAGLDEDAVALEALPELTAAELVDAALPTIKPPRSTSSTA